MPGVTVSTKETTFDTKLTNINNILASSQKATKL